MRILYASLLCLTFILLVLTGRTQHVINAGGGSIQYDTLVFHASLGEPITSGFQVISDNSALSLGFLQPLACLEILGQVLGPNEEVINDGSVILYLKKDDFKPWQISDTVDITDGTFEFVGFPDVDYVIKYLPSPTNDTLAISYADSTLFWSKARVFNSQCGQDIIANVHVPKKHVAPTSGTDVVNINPTQTHVNDVTQIIWQEQGKETEGADANGNMDVPFDAYFSVSGTIRTGTAGTGKVAKILADPIPGLDIVLQKTPPGTVVASTTTDDEGHYQFDNVPPGNYVIVIDYPGTTQKETYGFTVTHHGYTVITGRDFIIDQTPGPAGGIYIDPFDFAIVSQEELENGEWISIYPNPFHRVARVTLSPDMVSNNMRYTLSDITGKVLTQNKVGIQSTFYLHKNNLPPGIYLLNLYSHDTQHMKRVIIH